MDRPAGNAICALGGFCAWGSRHQKALGIKDSAEEFYTAMMDISAGRADPELTRVYTENIPGDTDWLEKNSRFRLESLVQLPTLDSTASVPLMEKE